MTLDQLTAEIAAHLAQAKDPTANANALRAAIHAASPHHPHPVDLITWVPLEHLTPNDYNPNTVARPELTLLRRSIEANGMTQPIVTSPDPITGRHTIVDGFHRYHVLNTTPTLREATAGMAPIVTLNTDAPGRIAATVRHNRARGTHTLTGMSNLIFQMLDAGMTDHEISTELGMSHDELTRLKHVTGFSRLFEDVEYNRAWLTKNQIRARLAYQAEHPDDPNDLP